MSLQFIMQNDIEQVKGQEIAKLQTALQEMQEKLDEAHKTIISEKQAARIVIEQAPTDDNEIPAIDNATLELLTSHNKQLEVKKA